MLKSLFMGRKNTHFSTRLSRAAVHGRNAARFRGRTRLGIGLGLGTALGLGIGFGLWD